MSLRRSLPAVLALAAVASPAAARPWNADRPGRPAPADPIELVSPPASPRRPIELVVNGGFEAIQLASGSWDVFDAVPGWRTARGPGIEIQHGVAGAPFEGAQHVELDSHASSAMYQMLPTAQGATYLVTYRVSPRPGTAPDDNQLEVRWGGRVIDTYVAATTVDETDWELRAVLVTARSRTTRLELADLSPANGLGAYVDDVSVRLVGRAPARPHR